MLRVRRGEEAFEVQSGGDSRYEGAGAVEEGEETVPIDRKEEGMVRGEEGSARGKRTLRNRICAVAQAGQGQARNGIGVREFGNEDELFRSRLPKNVKKVGLEKRLEAAFGGHPDGLGFEEPLQFAAAGGVGNVIVERTDGCEQRLVDARAGLQACTGRDFGPRDLRSAGGDFGIAGIPMRDAPGQLRGNAHEGMQNHKDALECAAIGFHERFAQGRISKLFRLH